MSFKLCTIAILIGICVFISNVKSLEESHESDEGNGCTIKLLETSKKNRLSSDFSLDCKGNVGVCLRYCWTKKQGDNQACFVLNCTKDSTAKTSTEEGNPSKQNKANDCPAQDCPPKDCETLREISGVSVGAAMGILVLGLFVGAMATAALCVCCPSVHAKASAVRTGKKKTCSDGNLEDDEISNANEQKSRPLPLAPLPSLPADIRATATTAQNANSGRPASQHIYSESMDLPVGSTNTYNAYGYDHANTNSSLAPVTSPTYGYNKLTNDVIPGTNSSEIAGSAYQTLNADRSQNAGYNQIPAVKDDGDLRSQEHNDPDGAHQYFVLEKKDAEMGSTETGHHDNDTSVPHDYFVLEKK